MPTTYYKLTNESPAVIIDCTGILFLKLNLRKGKIEELEFHMAWETYDEVKGVKISHNVSFNPLSYIESDMSENQRVYEFRINSFPLVYWFKGKRDKVNLSASLGNDQPFDLDVHVVINES